MKHAFNVNGAVVTIGETTMYAIIMLINEKPGAFVRPIKLIRDIFDLGLRESKELFEHIRDHFEINEGVVECTKRPSCVSYYGTQE